MSDPKNRFYKARRRAREILELTGYNVTVLSYGAFDLEAADESSLRKIKICIDVMTKNDQAALAALEYPSFCRKEIWLKKSESPDFKIIKIRSAVNG